MPLAKDILSSLGMPATDLERPRRGTNILFKTGNRFLKIYQPFFPDYESEVIAIPAMSGLPVATPRLLHHGPLGNGWSYALLSAVPGVLVEEAWTDFTGVEKIQFMADLGRLVRSVQALTPPIFPHRTDTWTEFIDKQAAKAHARHARVGLPEHLLNDVESFLALHLESVRHAPRLVLLTGEYTPENLLATKTPYGWQLSGMFDFGDAMNGHPEYDLLGPTLFYAAGNQSLQRAFFNAYYDAEYTLSVEARMRLMTLAIVHVFSDFNEQVVMPNWRAAENLTLLAQSVWP